MEIKNPVQPFSYDSAVKKVMLAERAWNSRNPEVVWLTPLIQNGAIGLNLFLAVRK